VTKPTVYAPYTAVVILILGLIVAGIMAATSSGTADFSGLSEADQGPLKI
jgi:hypothetical protein